MRLRSAIVIAAVLLAASAFAGVGAPLLTRAGSAPARAGTFSVLGTGVVTTRPDTARISAGVTTEGTTADEAIAENSDAMAKVIAALKAAGIASKDLQTE